MSRRPKTIRRKGFLQGRPRGQAMAETTLLTMGVLGWGAALMYFFPDSLNALQIYIDGFYYVLSLPIP